MNDVLDWRERPWTIRVIAGIGLIGIATSLATQFVVWNVIADTISLALLFGLWRGSPGVRRFYIFGMFVLVVASFIGLVAEPNEHWDGFTASVAMFALLLAPPTHEWAQEREQQRDLERARRRAAPERA